MSLMIESIFGVNLGFEFMPNEIVSDMDPEAKWGMLFDLLFVRVLFIKF